MTTELHSIKKFRGSNLGIIRLKKLAYPKNIKVKIGEEEFVPVAYDTYGHPIISEACFTYYKAIKSITERKGDSLIVEVTYTEEPFVIRNDLIDSAEAFKEILNCKDARIGLKRLKQALIYRKQASFSGKTLNTFILYKKYAIYSDGHIYMCTYDEMNDKMLADVISISEVTNFQLKEEVHIPGYQDVCAICGKHFDLNDVKNFAVTENDESSKVHTECLTKCREAVNYQKASKIIDAVYDDVPCSEIIREIDEDGKKEKIWYKYYTTQGDVALIEIKW